MTRSKCRAITETVATLAGTTPPSPHGGTFSINRISWANGDGWSADCRSR